MPEDQLELDLSKIHISKDKILHFLKKYSIFFLVLIPFLLSIYIRIIPADLPITDDWAKTTVDNYYKSQIKAQITQQYPNLPDQNINNLINQQYSEFQKQNKDQLSLQIKQTSQEFKLEFQDENGYTYMPDIDPYTYLRFARNYVEKGHVGDEVVDGVQRDTHSLAPNGRIATSNPHPVIIAYLYKIFKIFNSKITLMQSAAYHSVIFAALSIIPIFFIARMFAGNVGGFFAALMLAVNGAFLGRTTWGHADTDTYAILFASYFVWFIFLALKSDDFKKTALYSLLSAFTIGVFSIFWGGWWYIFDFALATILFYSAYVIYESKSYSLSKIKENIRLKHFALASSIMVVVSAVLVSLFGSVSYFFSSITGPISFTRIKVASAANLWPNVYTTVAELNTASFNEIINSIGGDLFFYLSIVGILLLLFTKTEDKRDHIPFALLIIFWYIGIFYASAKGIRFTMMLVPPLSLALGAVVGIGYKRLGSYLENVGISQKVTKTAIVLILLLIFIPYIKGAAAATKNDIPIVNDAWYDSLNKIRLESKPDAIINSWWDFGHHFKFFADRAVTFDGATQNSPIAHWIGKVLLTSNEKEAIGILRMLDCGSNDAFDILDSEVNDVSVTVKMLYNVVVMDKSSAQSYLVSKGINNEIIQKTLEKTHCNPPEDYFITSEDMVGKGSVWAHFGSWDFDRADMWTEGRDLNSNEFVSRFSKQLSISEEEAKRIYFEIKGLTSENEANAWIAPWPGYGGEQGCSKQNSKLICGGVSIDLETKDTQISTDNGIQKPYSLVYSENNNLVEKKFDDGLAQSILLLKENDSYSIMIASKEVATSLFTRLFFYNGVGAQHFEKFSEERSIIGNHIIVWKVKW